MGSPQIALQTDVTNRLLLFHCSWDVAISGVGYCGKKNHNNRPFLLLLLFSFCLWLSLIIRWWNRVLLCFLFVFCLLSPPHSLPPPIFCFGDGYLMWLAGMWWGSLTTRISGELKRFGRVWVDKTAFEILQPLSLKRLGSPGDYFRCEREVGKCCWHENWWWKTLKCTVLIMIFKAPSCQNVSLLGSTLF